MAAAEFVSGRHSYVSVLRLLALDKIETRQKTRSASCEPAGDLHHNYQ
jgi:hypothetical protein